MEEQAKLVSDNLKQGKVVCIPTDTIYGLSVNAFDREALTKIKKLKRKSGPFIILTDSLNKIRGIINEIPPAFYKLKSAGIIPGPITMLFKSRVRIEDITSEEGKIAVRLPKNDFLEKIFSRIDFPIISTSANIKGEKYSKSIKNAKQIFKNSVDLYIDKGPINKESSTIIDISEENIKYLREGMVSLKKINKILVDN